MTKVSFLVKNDKTGHSYVSKQFADALNCDVEMWVTEGRQPSNIWDGYKTHKLNCGYFEVGNYWDKIEKLAKNTDIVFLNEWYDWSLVKRFKDLGVKVVSYAVADAVSKNTLSNYEIYDAVFSPAEHLYDEMFELPQSYYIPWAVEPRKKTKGKYMFQHNAGWGGVNFRKATPEVIKAYDSLRQEGVDVEMELNTQTVVYPDATVQRIKRWRGNGLHVNIGSIPYKDLYKDGKVYVGPSKYEGLGLYIPEAMSAGIPVITTDAYPMKQFVEHGNNGYLIPTAGETKQPWDIIFPRYELDYKDIKRAMSWFINNKDKIDEMSKNARNYVKENHNLEQFNKKVNEIISGL